jgi:hypothetical protein
LSNIKGIISILWEAVLLVLLMQGIYGFVVYAVEIALVTMILYISSFMNNGTDVQAILKFCLRNLRGCNVGVTDGRDIYGFQKKPVDRQCYIFPSKYNSFCFK